jgi:hypothetical protein
VPNLALAALDEVIEQVGNGLRVLASNPVRLRSMTSFPHFRFAG